MDTYKFNGRADKLIEKIIQHGGFVYGDYTIQTKYLRNNNDIKDVQTETTTINNLYDYDSDFDDEPVNKTCSIPSYAMKDYYTDMFAVQRLKIIRLPNDLKDIPNDTFITVSQYRAEKANIVYHTQHVNKFGDNKSVVRTTKELSTIKFTDNTEMYGEVNLEVIDSLDNMSKIVNAFQPFASISCSQPIENGQTVFKCGKRTNDDIFKL